MLLDSSSVDRSVAACVGATWQSSRVAAAGRRPATDFLTLPDLQDGIPTLAKVRHREEAPFVDLVIAQFKHGPLRAADVNDPVDAGDAFQQAFYAWVQRQLPTMQRLCFGAELMDSNAVHDAIAHQYERNEFTPTSPLHLAMKLPEEHLYVIGARGDALGAIHPLLLPSVLRLVDQASCKTLFVRTPGWFLSEFSCWHWEGDENASDDEVREFIADYRGLEGEDADRYLPSAVKPEFYPDEIRKPASVPGRRRKNPLLSECELLKLRTRCRGMARRVCTELIVLTRLLRHAGKRDLFQDAHDGSPAYSACSIALTDSERIGELLDDHFEQESQSGEYTYYSGFSPFASTRGAIRRQYADWALAFQILSHLDRLLALVTI